MPLELGLFLGCRRYGSPRDRRKICLVFDTERHRFQQFISDISGQDVTPHRGDPARAVRGVSEWFRSSSGRRSILGGTEILRRFEKFRAELPAMSARVHLTVDELTFADRTQFISRWLIEDSRLR